MLPLFLMSAACCRPPRSPAAFSQCLAQPFLHSEVVLSASVGFWKRLMDKSSPRMEPGPLGAGCLWMVVINEGIDGQALPF